MESGDGTAEQFSTPNKAPVEVDHHSSFVALNEEESSVPEIQRLQGLFESIDLELEDAQITRVKDGDDSDQDSDDGLKQEVKELPNSSILDLHTITTSAKGGRFLVTPSSFRQPRGEEDEYDIHHLSQAEGLPSTPLADKSNRTNFGWENTTDLDAEKDTMNRKTSQTPARVTFAPTDPDADLDDLLNTLSTPVPSNNNTTSNNKTPMSAGQHGFTPMTLQELMKLETPESKVDEMLEELYQLMGYYNRTSEFLETQTTPFGTTESANFSDTVTESSESAGEKVDLFGVSPISSSDITPPPTDTAGVDVAASKLATAATTDTTTIGETTTDTANTDQDPLYRQRLRSASVDFDHDIKDIMQMSINGANLNNTNSNTSAPFSPLDKSTFRSGWVDVTPKTTYTSGVLTPNTHTNATPSSHAKLHESIVHGDFYIWSHGSKLTAESINSSYVGLNPTSVTHNNDNGVLVPATLPSPSVPGSQLPREVNMHTNSNTVGISGIRGSNILPNQGTSANASHNAGYGVVPRTDTKHGYYVVYLLECVVRPDIELRDLLACVLKVARTRDCKAIFPHNNHIVLKSQSNTGYPQLPSTHAHSTAHPNTTTAPNPNSIEWDQIDVQVVLSHSVKQRMLVCQFLRRVPSLASSGFGNLNLIIYQIAGGAAPLCLENSPKTKSFVSKLKRELTEANLCLSSLYNAPLNTVCKLPQPGGLDAHFRAQLHQQVYGHMWSRLENDVKGMSEHLQAQLKECNEFRHTLEPIYKIYNMPSPLPWSSASHRNQTPIAINNNTLSVDTTPNIIRSEANTTSASGAKSSVNVLYSPTAGHKSHNTRTALLMQNSNATKSIQTPGAATSGVHITPSTADRILDTYLNTSTPSHANSTPFKSTEGVTTPYANTDTTNTNAMNNSTLTSVSTTSNLSPMPHSPRYVQSASDSTSAPNSPLPMRYDAVEDGMTTVLLTLNECLQELQESSDEEYARRVQMQNEWVVRQVDNMQDYKQSLLFSLAANLEAEDSSLMKTFHATFYDVPTIIDVYGNTAFKSHNNSRTNSGSNSRTNSTERPSATATTNTTSASTDVANSNVTPSTVKPNDLYSEVLVEASLFNEFLDTPPPKSLTNKASNNASVSGTGNNSTTAPDTTATVTPSKGWMSSLISSFYNNPVTQENALVGFKPKELRPVQTQADVNRRLSQYHTQHTQNSYTTKGTKSTNNSEARGSGLATDDYQQVESLISLTPIVLYYCSCLVSKMPGTVYITPTTICLTYNAGLLTLNKIKEIYPITALHTVYLPNEWQNTTIGAANAHASGMLDSNALKLVFYKSALTPVKPKSVSAFDSALCGSAGNGVCSASSVFRKPLVAGNWKMNTDLSSAHFLATEVVSLTNDLKFENIEIALFPPFPFIHTVKKAVFESAQNVKVGAQSVFFETSGAYTAAVSAPMLKSLECDLVLVGHSERRSVFKESNAEINKSLKQVQAHGMVPILCVGETLQQYESGQNKAVISEQLEHGLAGLSASEVAALIIAYEPVWAIGTGKVATPAIAQDIHAYIRTWLHSHYGEDAASKVRILYGGSVTPESIRDLIRSPDIDGALVGGASLKASAFASIVRTAAEVGLTKGL
eukprot:gene8787-10396_t